MAGTKAVDKDRDYLSARAKFFQRCKYLKNLFINLWRSRRYNQLSRVSRR